MAAVGRRSVGLNMTCSVNGETFRIAFCPKAEVLTLTLSFVDFNPKRTFAQRVANDNRVEWREAWALSFGSWGTGLFDRGGSLLRTKVIPFHVARFSVEPNLPSRASNERTVSDQNWEDPMTRPQGALLVPMPTAKVLGLALVLGIVFAAQIPSAAEAFGVKKSNGTLGGFGAGGGLNRGGPNLTSTSGRSSRTAGGDADLRIRSGSSPTITQTARPGFRAGFGVWGGWNRSGLVLTGTRGASPSIQKINSIRSSDIPKLRGRPLRGEAENIKAVIHPAPRGFDGGRGTARGGPGFDSIRSIGPLAGGFGWDRISAYGPGNSNVGPRMKHHQTTRPAGGGGGTGIGWGCRTCGFTNGTQLTGLKVPRPGSLAPAAVTLPSGDIVDLRASQPE